MGEKRLDRSYAAIVVSLMLVLPAASACADYAYHGALIAAIGRWLAFWAVGVRLATAGLRQIANPGFTARTIFHARNEDSFIIVRELGFANFCMGLVGIVSVAQATWREPAAWAGGLFFAIAGVMHVVKRPAGPNEVVAMLSDVFIAAVMAFYLAAG